MYGEKGSIVDLDGIAKKRPYCMVAGDIEAVVEVGILILRRDIGMEKEGLFCFSFSGILYTISARYYDIIHVRQNYTLDLPVALDFTLRRLCMQYDFGI